MNFEFVSNWSDDAEDVQDGDPQSPIAPTPPSPRRPSSISTSTPSSTPPAPTSHFAPECHTPGFTPTSRASEDAPALRVLYAMGEQRSELVIADLAWCPPILSQHWVKVMDLADRKKAKELATSDICKRDKHLGSQTAKRELSQREHKDKRLKVHHDQAVAQALRREIAQHEFDEKRIRLEHQLTTRWHQTISPEN